MGTVGLNFGSPTSGTGFDVSATVSTIVANLQKVETPWKNQLSSLQSQDTAISSLGTLLSNLSNDMTSLTDFNGVMAQKTGSSSDTNVLQLTYATSSATAGTHTVVVSQLAQTSSGFLSEISNASDTLQGSVTITVGSGTPQTVSLPSSGGTLQSLMAAINSAGVGVIANVLTDSSGSRLSLTSSTSGANGNVSITSNITDTSLYTTGISLAYTDNTPSGATGQSGTLTAIPNGGDTLTGDVSITGPDGTATDFKMSDLASGSQTLSGLASAINSASIGVTASLVNNSDGSVSLSLQSTGTMSVTSSLSDASPTLGYTSSVQGSDAVLSIDGVQNLKSSSNTVTNLIPGLTFQLLSTSPEQSDGSLEPIQVVVGNDNSGVESAMATMVADYNSLVSVMDMQEGNDASGNPEPLFGSPTLSLLQQQLLGVLNEQNPNGSLDPIASNTDTVLSGKMSISVGGGTATEIDVPDSPNNTLQDLADAINAAGENKPIAFSGTQDSNGVVSSGTLSANATATLEGDITIQVGDGSPVTINVPDSPSNTIAGLASQISLTANLGVTVSTSTTNGVTTMTLTSSDGDPITVTSNVVIPGAGFSAQVETSNNTSYLMLQSATSGSNGALSVTSQISATSDQLLSYVGSAGQDATSTTQATYSNGALSGIPDATGDILSGTLTITVGNGESHTITLGTGTTTSDGTPVDTLNALMTYINENEDTLGMSAGTTTNAGPGTTSLTLNSLTEGSAGTLTITSNILDTTNTSTTSLNYNNSSDISSLGALGISMNNDGTISFDASMLDSLLDTDFSGVVGMFQSVNSWGQNFATMLNNAGTTSSIGLLKLAQQANSNIESTLNADISKEELLISAQQTSLTDELNSANEILQELPNQLSGMDMLYSAITGYNQNTNG